MFVSVFQGAYGRRWRRRASAWSLWVPLTTLTVSWLAPALDSPWWTDRWPGYTPPWTQHQLSPPSTSQPQRPGARPSPSSDFDFETLIYSVLNTEIHQDRLWEDHYCWTWKSPHQLYENPELFHTWQDVSPSLFFFFFFPDSCFNTKAHKKQPKSTSMGMFDCVCQPFRVMRMKRFCVCGSSAVKCNATLFLQEPESMFVSVKICRRCHGNWSVTQAIPCGGKVLLIY